VPFSEYRKLSDEELVHRYVHRAEAVCINVLYERYGHLILGVCFKYLRDSEAAKDATQQIFIKLLEDLKRFQIQHFRAWLLQVSRNHCLMQLRKHNPVVNSGEDLADDVEFEDNWHQKVEHEQLLTGLEAALTELNAPQRDCIERFYLKKQSYAEIAAETSYTLNDIKSHIQNGKRNLKNKLQSTTNRTVQL
jgi:RNA polymerase sigma-70 factor (ECF subfamily)